MASRLASSTLWMNFVIGLTDWRCGWDLLFSAVIISILISCSIGGREDGIKKGTVKMKTPRSLPNLFATTL
jgi:hypothetical protein